VLINLKICHSYCNSQVKTVEALTFYLHMIHFDSIISSLGLLLSRYRINCCVHFLSTTSILHVHEVSDYKITKLLLLFLGLLLLRNSDKSYSRCNIQIEKLKFSHAI